MGAHYIPKIDYVITARRDGYRGRPGQARDSSGLGGSAAAPYSSEASLTSSACRLHSILFSSDATCLRTVSTDD